MKLLCLLGPVGFIIAASIEPALAQAHNPFSVGISEGGGSATGLTGWLLSQQGWLEHELSQGVRLARLGGAVWPLVGMSLVYGIFHAAGPGHGKAVLSSYMVANERALRRGIVLSFAAAILQGGVAILLIGSMTLLLHATAASMKSAASLVETCSFLAIVMLGLVLVWRKGRALVRLWAEGRDAWRPSGRHGTLFDAPVSAFALPGGGQVALRPAHRFAATAVAGEPDAGPHPADCLLCHGPDPRTLTGARVDWREAIGTVLAAGLRPCSGAILVLVFAFSQGVFGVGIVSVLAMSIGVAVTTAALAIVAVLFKSLAARLAGRGTRRVIWVGAGLEFTAACVVLFAGCLLLMGYAGSLGGA